MSGITSILEVERSVDSCMRAGYMHLAYFRSAVVKTLCKYAKSIIKHVHCVNMGIGCNKNDNNKINKSGSRFKRQLLVVNKNPW